MFIMLVRLKTCLITNISLESMRDAATSVHHEVKSIFPGGVI